jgi:phage tail sheath gpL-like
MRSLAYIRYAFRSRIQLRFPRHKLADDGTNFSPGQAITTPAIVRTELLALGSELESLGIIEGFDQYSQDMLVERNASNNDRLDIRIAPDLINQLLVTAAQVQFLL